MKFNSTKSKPLEPDMTPMIDVVFLLISFFSILVNFSQADQNQRINLPVSEIAKPPDTPPTEPITLNVYPNGIIEFQGKEYDLSSFKKAIDRYGYLIKQLNIKTSDVTVIIRADGDSPSGLIQDIIEHCQSQKLEIFKLRAKQNDLP
ncbi:MAG: biopolymer transporter ExbD [Planctomycetaceae bacterium]|jgi:biopolymer transport protein ExbD|nr:biopolymer transporter ExbD [Planctomycetaceae bacterium]